MKFTKIKVFLTVIIILILGVIITVAFNAASQDNSGKYNTFANCLINSGTTFYGAFWCPHCQAEKKLFGSSEKLLPYVECSTPDGTQNQLCKDKKILSYPTWELADGTRLPDENASGVSLETLSKKTSCPLPQ